MRVAAFPLDDFLQEEGVMSRTLTRHLLELLPIAKVHCLYDGDQSLCRVVSLVNIKCFALVNLEQVLSYLLIIHSLSLLVAFEHFL